MRAALAYYHALQPRRQPPLQHGVGLSSHHHHLRAAEMSPRQARAH